MEISLIALISYLLGSIPFGFLLTRIFLKKDIRTIGSGNIGATNALRTGNKVIGYSTLILDILKAVIPILVVKVYFSEFIFISSLSVFNLSIYELIPIIVCSLTSSIEPDSSKTKVVSVLFLSIFSPKVFILNKCDTFSKTFITINVLTKT